MSPHELSRLERVEKFIERLTLGSYLAKAADTGSRVIGDRALLEPGEQDLASTVTGGNDTLGALKKRVEQLENLWRVAIQPTLDKPSSPVAQGEAVLAKAASAYNDADSLMALGEREISDPTQMGVFSSHLAANDLSAARDVLLGVRERTHAAKAADAAQQVDRAFGGGLEGDMASYDARAGMSELTARFTKIEQLMASLEVRLSQLERRPQAAAPVDDGQTVAKASGPKRKRTKEEIEAQLYADLNAYVDSPTVTGQISSMIAGGQYKQVRQVLANAKRAHESEKIAAERKRF